MFLHYTLYDIYQVFFSLTRSEGVLISRPSHGLQSVTSVVVRLLASKLQVLECSLHAGQIIHQLTVKSDWVRARV